MKKTILFLFYILLPLYWTKRLFSQKFWQDLSRINEGFNNDRGTYNPKTIRAVRTLKVKKTALSI